MSVRFHSFPFALFINEAFAFLNVPQASGCAAVAWPAPINSGFVRMKNSTIDSFGYAGLGWSRNLVLAAAECSLRQN
jgi:hypothetical protein